MNRANGSSASDNFNHLVVGAGRVNADQSNQEITLGPETGYNTELGLFGVDEAQIDQSNSKILVKGIDGEDTCLNRIDGCDDLTITQNNTTSIVESSGSFGMTVANHITNTKNFTFNMKNSTIVVGGSKSSKKRGGGITAHTVVDGDAHVVIKASGVNQFIGCRR